MGKDQSFAGIFVLARGARAEAPQERADVMTLVTIVPDDHQLLVADLLDPDRNR